MSRTISFTVFTVTAILLSWCLISTLVNRVVNTSGQYVTDLDNRGWIEDINHWFSTVNRLETALSWNPLDVDLLMRLARLYRWRAFDQRLSPKLARESHHLAIRYVKAACRRRPSSGLAWATLAVVKAAAGHIDQEMILALNRAMALGPWERQVQHQVVLAGIQTWNRLPTNTQHRMLEIVDRALKDSTLSRIVIETAIRHNWQAPLEPLLQNNQRLKRLFKSIDVEYKKEH